MACCKSRNSTCAGINRERCRGCGLAIRPRSDQRVRAKGARAGERRPVAIQAIRMRQRVLGGSSSIVRRFVERATPRFEKIVSGK